MATSSFFTEVNITTEEQLEEILTALEESERRAMLKPPIEQPENFRWLRTPEEIKDLALRLSKSRGGAD